MRLRSGAGRAESLALPASPESAVPEAPGAILPGDSVWESALAVQHGTRDFVLRRVLAAADVLGVAAAMALAFVLSSGSRQFTDWLLVIPILCVWLGLFKAYGLYDRELKRINHGVLDDVPGLSHALVIGTLLTWVYYRFVAAEQLVMLEVAVFVVTAFVVVLILRSAGRRAIRGIYGSERVLFVGDDPLTPTLLRKLRVHSEYGLEPIGIVSRNDYEPVPDSVRILGCLDDLDLEETIKHHRIERVIVSHRGFDEELMPELLRSCGRLSVKVSMLPSHVDVMGPSIEVDNIEGVTVLGLNPLVLSRSSRFLKRGMDIAVASVILLLATPLMGLLAAAIRLESRGPILFRQDRIGRRGRTFQVLKFRTMVEAAELLVDELAKESRDPNWLQLDHDPRVTRVGRVLRLWSFDELPQLWNVLKGEMSIVGPRPLPVFEDERVKGWARSRLELAPGITGMWQVLGRTNIPFVEMVKLDYVYVTNWSLWTDIKLILKTLPIVLGRRGAN